MAESRTADESDAPEPVAITDHPDHDLTEIVLFDDDEQVVVDHAGGESRCTQHGTLTRGSISREQCGHLPALEQSDESSLDRVADIEEVSA